MKTAQNDKKTKVFVSQRILTRYREDTFYELSRDPKLDMFVAFGDRRSKTFRKYASIKQTPRFKYVRMKTISLVFERFGHVNQIFFSPGIFFHLIRHRPDVVLTEGTSNILNNLITCTFCLITKTPYIWWDLGKIRGQESENIFRRVLSPLIKFYYCKAAVLLGYSSFAKDYFRAQGIAKDKIVVAGNTIRLEKHLQYQKNNAAKAQRLKEKIGFYDRFTFLAVGGIEKSKRFDLLIRVFTRLEHEYKNLGLVLVGEGAELPRLKAMVQSYQKIHFAGAHFDDIGLYFSIADLFVLPGLGGLAINEAMAYGLPVIAGPADGTELDLVKDCRTGFLIGMNSEVDLYDKMKWCIENPEKAKRMGRCARELVTGQFSLNQMITNIKLAIEKALPGNG